MSVLSVQSIKLLQVESLYQQVQAELPDSIRLRVHRAMSWLKQAQQSDT